MPNPYLDADEPWLDTTPDPIPTKRRRGPAPMWVVHMSHHPVAGQRGLTEGFICIGWVKAGDLSRFPSQEALKTVFDRHYPGEASQCVANWAGDARRFLMEMNRGDLFVFPVTGGNEIHIGRVTGDYRFAGTDAELVAGDSASIRTVQWLAAVPRSVFSAEAISCFNSEHTVHSGADHRAEVVSVLASRGIDVGTLQ